MVSGTMGALDIAPTLHFVEPGLKINAEEWIKVMDEYIAPTCTALMEPVRKSLLILDNAPSHACRLACDHYRVARHSRFSTALLSRSLSLGLLFCGTSSRHSLFSIQLLPIPQNCGHF